MDFWIFFLNFWLGYFLDFLDFLDFLNYFRNFGCFEFFLDFLCIFFCFFGIPFKVTTIKLPRLLLDTKNCQNSIIRSFFSQRAKKATAEGRRPPQQKELGPRSRPYLLVSLKEKHFFVFNLSGTKIIRNKNCCDTKKNYFLKNAKKKWWQSKNWDKKVCCKITFFHLIFSPSLWVGHRVAMFVYMYVYMSVCHEICNC